MSPMVAPRARRSGCSASAMSVAIGRPACLSTWGVRSSRHLDDPDALFLSPERAVLVRQLGRRVLPLLLADRSAQDRQHRAGMLGGFRLRGALELRDRVEERVER